MINTNLMIHKVVKLFHHNLFEDVQISDRDSRFLSDIESATEGTVLHRVIKHNILYVMY